jgi:DNA-binding NarL/FixJ family response regulator
MKGMDGLQVLRILRKEYPDIRVLVLSAMQDQVYATCCLEYGINGYLTKDIEVGDLVEAIRCAYRGEVYDSNLLREASLYDFARRFHKKTTNLLPGFSEEELQIIQLLSWEKTTEEIAAALFISKRSVEVKREKIKEKAGVKTVGGLLLYCMKRGIIE